MLRLHLEDVIPGEQVINLALFVFVNDGDQLPATCPQVYTVQSLFPPLGQLAGRFQRGKRITAGCKPVTD